MNEIKEKLLFLRDGITWSKMGWGRAKEMMLIPIDIYQFVFSVVGGSFFFKEIFGLNISKDILIKVAIFGPIIMLIMAYIDKRWLHLWQREKELDTKLNPYFVAIYEKLDKIINILENDRRKKI